MKENNELIREFMQPTIEGQFIPTGWKVVVPDYHLDWNELQPVFVKIMQTRHDKLKDARHLALWQATQYHSLSANYLLDIDLMYRNCVEFITYYNTLP